MRCTVEYRCPRCRRLAFKASGPVTVAVEVRCTKCRQKVAPVSESDLVIRTYRCSSCRREQTCVNPVNDRAICIPCGTPTLSIVAELNGQSPPRAEPRAEEWSSA